MEGTAGSFETTSKARLWDTALKLFFPVLQITSPGGRFSKVPKLYGPFSGVTIPFVTQERRAFNQSNFTVTFLFVTLKEC